MKQYLNRLFVAGVMLAALVIAGNQTANAQNLLGEILNRMDAHNRSLKSLRARIKMVKTNVQLNENDLYEGSIQYLPAQSVDKIRIRVDWEKPAAEQLAVGKGQYILYRPRLNQAIIGKVEGAKGNAGAGGALAFLSMNRTQLKANYDATYIGEETVGGNTRTWHIRLTPKNVGTYKAADLWVDVNGMPVQAKVVEKNNDTTTVFLYDIIKNADVDSSVFSIKPPKGTQIVQG
jgi:outer membrane lipoprotein-sorting protein